MHWYTLPLTPPTLHPSPPPRPVLTVNKMDRCFLELQLDAEEAYQAYLRVIENTNVVMATYQDDAMGDLQVRSPGALQGVCVQRA
jgi:translation elongation factor EF-G